MRLMPVQRRVAVRMGAGVAITLAAVAAAMRWTEPVAAVETRLLRTVGYDLVLVAFLAAAVANVARLRFFSPADIDGSTGGQASPAVAAGNAVLQNTLEQVALALPVHLALALLRTDGTGLVAALTGLFATGRLLFWIGYRHGAAARAFGFALTFYPTVAGLIVAAVAIPA